MAKRLPSRADVLELDVNDPDAARGRRGGARGALGRARRRAARDRVRARATRSGGNFLDHADATSRHRGVPDERVLAEGAGRGAAAAAGAGEAARVVGLDFDATRRVAGLRLGGRLEGRARVGQPLPRARPRAARRARRTSWPPARCDTMAARGIDGFEDLAEHWERQAPLGWDLDDPTPVADACLSCSRPSPGRSPARSCTSTAASTRSGAAADQAASESTPTRSRRRR